jgi:hypothetical protein
LNPDGSKVQEPLHPEDAPTGIYGPDGRPQFFVDATMDRFVAAFLNLASEVWVQEERILALEAAAAPGSAPLDRDAALKIFIDRVLAPLREPKPSP